MMLNLKKNNIKDIFPLRECTSLVYLNVANNKITHCEPLKALHKLANLHLEDNLIKNQKSLKGLDNCKGLVFFTLNNIYRTLSGMDPNEICEEKDYRNQNFQMI